MLQRIFFLLCIGLLVPMFSTGVLAEASRAPLVRLRVVNGPIGRWESSLKGFHVTQATVKVKNTSAAAAKGISVFLKVPGGREVKMEGPSSLEKYEVAEYTMSKSTPSLKRGKLWVRFKCKNCRK